MKHLKLFFALFAMLALNVGNAWGAEATINFKEKGLENGVQYSDPFTIDANTTITFAGGGNDGKYYTTGEGIRTYGGGTITVECTNGTISEISFTWSGNSYKPTADVATPAGYSTSTGKWTGSASSVTLTRPSGSGHWRLQQVTVTYETAGGGETPDPTPDPEPDPTPDPEPGTGGEETWTLVTNGSDLKAGDIIVIASNTKGLVASNTITSGYMGEVSTTFSADKTTITTLPAEAAQLTIGGTSGAWTLTYDGKQLGATAVKKVAWDNGTMTWSITIADDGGATIQNGTNTYGRFLHNVSSTRFTTYTSNVSSSMLLPQIYKKVTTTDEPGSGETAASLTANPTSLDFGNVTQNNEVEAKTFTISGSDFTTGELTITAPSGYTVNPTTVPVNGTLEETTITVTPNTSTVGPFNGNVTISGANLKSSVNVALSMTVEKAPATPTENVYVKVTSTAGITDGEYLIVYEDASNATPAPVAFDGSLTTLDAAKNTVAVGISNSTIAGNTDIDAALFTIDVTAGTLKSASGKYIGVSSNSNGLKTEDVAKDYKNAFSVDDNGNAVIAADFEGSTMSLRYNNTAGDNNLRFRYYKNAGQQPIALYKKASKHIVTIADCTNGSVSAKIGETALVTNDQVLSGIQITLSNEATTGYKLSAYDVYKTDDATTKVTVANDNTFIMPEFDVTISATFVPAKTLTSIEITTAATQTTFWQGETFNYTGLEVTAHFDGAADEVVTPTVTGSTATAGTQTVTVSFTEGSVTKTTTYNITVNAIPNTKETAYTVADAFDIIDKLTTADGVFIKGIVSQVDEYFPTYKSITYWISVDGTTTNQLQVYSGKGLEGADFVDINGVSVEDQVIVCGNLKKYSGTYEFDKNNYLAEHTKTTKADPELSYTPTEYNVNLGEAFTAPTLNNTHNLTVTYSSNNEDVATVAADGAVTIKAAGTVVITASFAGNDDYIAGSASYTINITDPNLLEVTFDATQDLDANNTERGEGKIIKAPITFACTDGILGSSTYGHYRIYANAKATFSAAEGYIITKVVLTSTASNDSQYGPGLLSTEEGYTYSGKGGTWVGEAYTVTLSASAQVRATTITVYYKQDNRVDAGLAWNPATVSLTVGDAFTAPTFINPKNVTGIEFTSSNDALATVSNAGVITLKDGVAGKATITALFKGNENYKPAEVTCTITVDHKSEDVVILAKCKDQYYALVAEYVTDKTDVLKALPVEYVGGKIYNVETEDQASIIWKRVVVDGKTTFQNGDNYLSAVNSAALKLEEEACDWIFENDMYKIEGADRTILYYATTGGFKNYSTSNMSADGVSGEYSSNAITVAPVFADGDAYHRTVTSGNYGTMCIPYGTSNYSGAKFYEVSWFETGNALWLDEVNGALVAGKPYIFLATASEIAIIGNGTTAAAPVAGVKGLTGTFTDIAAGGVTNNYIIAQNCIWVANDNNYVNAYRAYIKASELPTTEQAQLPGRRRVCMGENAATGFDNIVAPEGQAVKVIENGQLIIIRDGVKYNVQGQKL